MVALAETSFSKTSSPEGLGERPFSKAAACSKARVNPLLTRAPSETLKLRSPPKFLRNWLTRSPRLLTANCAIATPRSIGFLVAMASRIKGAS